MKVAITGSWRDSDEAQWGLRDKAHFRDAIGSLGGELALLGHQLVVATDSFNTADGCAVDGVDQRLPPRKLYDHPVVLVLHEDDDPPTFGDLNSRRPGFLSFPKAPPDGSLMKLYQVEAADVVLAIGGADKTLQACVAAALTGKRVVPVGCFGGGAHQAAGIFEAIDGRWGPHIPSKERLGQLKAGWTSGTIELVLDSLGVRYPQLVVVHGRDHDRRDELVKLLQGMGLPEPVIMELVPDRGLTLPQKWESVAKRVDAAIALALPDDLGGLLSGTVKEQRVRARQNVVLEVGWFWGRLGLPRVFLATNDGEVELPADLQGLVVNRFKESPAELEGRIAAWIEDLGWPRPSPVTTGADG